MNISAPKRPTIQLQPERGEGLHGCEVAPKEWSEPFRGMLVNTTGARVVAECKPIFEERLPGLGNIVTVQWGFGEMVKNQRWMPWSTEPKAPGLRIKFEAWEKMPVWVRFASTMPCYITPGVATRAVGRW